MCSFLSFKSRMWATHPATHIVFVTHTHPHPRTHTYTHNGQKEHRRFVYRTMRCHHLNENDMALDCTECAVTSIHLHSSTLSFEWTLLQLRPIQPTTNRHSHSNAYHLSSKWINWLSLLSIGSHRQHEAVGVLICRMKYCLLILYSVRCEAFPKILFFFHIEILHIRIDVPLSVNWQSNPISSFFYANRIYFHILVE